MFREGLKMMVGGDGSTQLRNQCKSGFHFALQASFFFLAFVLVNRFEYLQFVF